MRQTLTEKLGNLGKKAVSKAKVYITEVMAYLKYHSMAIEDERTKDMIIKYIKEYDFRYR